MRQELVIHVGEDIESVEGDSQVEDLVVEGGSEDFLDLNHTVESSHSVVIDIEVRGR